MLMHYWKPFQGWNPFILMAQTLSIPIWSWQIKANRHEPRITFIAMEKSGWLRNAKTHAIRLCKHFDIRVLHTRSMSVPWNRSKNTRYPFYRKSENQNGPTDRKTIWVPSFGNKIHCFSLLWLEMESINFRFFNSIQWSVSIALIKF